MVSLSNSNIGSPELWSFKPKEAKISAHRRPKALGSVVITVGCSRLFGPSTKVSAPFEMFRMDEDNRDTRNEQARYEVFTEPLSLATVDCAFVSGHTHTHIGQGLQSKHRALSKISGGMAPMATHAAAQSRSRSQPFRAT